MKPRDLASVERVCIAIRQASKAFPDMRVGQLLENVSGPEDLFNLENDDLVQALQDFVRLREVIRQ